jgi:ATP-dependent Clp protease ATP-binding subunit ClpA
MEERVMEVLRSTFRPEFLNRIDEIVIFNALGLTQIKEIADIQIEHLRRRLAERKITIDLTDDAKQAVAEKGYDPVYGARPLKRTIQKLIQDPLANDILKGDFKEGDHVVVDVDKDKNLVLTKEVKAHKKEKEEKKSKAANE